MEIIITTNVYLFDSSFSLIHYTRSNVKIIYGFVLNLGSLDSNVGTRIGNTTRINTLYWDEFSLNTTSTCLFSLRVLFVFLFNP